MALNTYVSSDNGLANLISCPSLTQCTVSSVNGDSGNPNEVTFNPQAPGHLTPEATGGHSGSIACPSLNECLTVDLYGNVVLGTTSGHGGGGGGGAGSAKCLVPKVKGKTLAAAKNAIVKAHCAVGNVKRVHSKHVKKGHVVSQNPPAGRSLRAGSKVSLVVSKG